MEGKSMAKVLQRWLVYMRINIHKELQVGVDLSHNFFYVMYLDEVVSQ